MLIIIDKPGQLGNRLWAYTPFISDALKNNYKIVILHFYDYCEYFENLKRYNNVKFIKRKKIAYYYGLMVKVLDLMPKNVIKHIGINIIKDENICVTKLNVKRNLTFIKGWSHIKPNNQINNNMISKLFQPKCVSIQKVNEILWKQRNEFDLIIGVHIRRGDYKKHRNGEYFYSHSTYANFMSQLSNQFNKRKKLTFLLCSNEEINTEIYSDFSVFQINDANLIEDLYGLSKCDYIMGPPSTYSMWASFYGQKPLLIIKNPNLKLKIKDFDVIIAQNKFKNGNVFSQ
ncbi:MAG: alpha-1,2-fucosyltransferase [Flavobacteriales bacterium]